MAEKVFAKGIRVFGKQEKAPDWVLGTVIISLNELFTWAKNEGKEYLSEYKGEKQIKLQCTKKEGGFLLSVDTYKPDVKAETKQESVVKEPLKEDDLPF